MKYVIKDSWKAPDTYSFQADNGQTVTLRTHVLTLEDGKKVSVSKKPEFEGFVPLQEYELEVSDEKSKSGKTFKAKHITQMMKCPCGCNYEGPASEFRPQKAAAPLSPIAKEIPF